MSQMRVVKAKTLHVSIFSSSKILAPLSSLEILLSYSDKQDLHENKNNSDGEKSVKSKNTPQLSEHQNTH